MLRDYQQRSIDMLYDWFRSGNDGNPCMVLPTGAGKSHIVAALCQDAMSNWPSTRILMLTHVKELIEQNAEKLRSHWPGAPMGIYSAGMGKRELGEPVTFAGIQSVRNKAQQIGHIDLCIIDECHLVSHKNEGGYRNLISELQQINPQLRVIGLTASPWRLGHGKIDEGEALFDDLIEPVTIEELVHKGYLAPLKSKVTQERLDTKGVKKRGGEYVESDLQKAVDTDDHNAAIADEIIERSGDRSSWLLFCTGVDHAHHMADALNQRGISAACITGATPKQERAQIIADFKAGKITALTNANVLTTGFDHPDIDLIAMLRPTMSPVLYIQMAGRGLRPKSHTDNCLVLDFAGVVEQHGPITAVQAPTRKGNSEGDAPVKVCDNCFELVTLSARQCPECGSEFPEPESKEEKLRLRSDDIMGMEHQEMSVTGWRWRKHVSRSSGKEMIAVTYYGALSDKPITEYFPITHEGFAGQKAVERLAEIARLSGAEGALAESEIKGIADKLNESTAPSLVNYKPDGKFYRITARRWQHEEPEQASDGSQATPSTATA